MSDKCTIIMSSPHNGNSRESGDDMHVFGLKWYHVKYQVSSN